MGYERRASETKRAAEVTESVKGVAANVCIEGKYFFIVEWVRNIESTICVK